MNDEAIAAPLGVLVVDPQSQNLKDLWSVLEPAGYRISGWANGQSEGMDLAFRRRPDAVLVDVDLVEGDGIDLAAQLSQAGIGPVLIIADRVRPDLARRAAEAGVFGYLVRPVGGRKLLASLEVARGIWMNTREQAQRMQAARERLETRQAVDQAKEMLMASCGYGEAQAYRFLQELSMNSRTPMREVAEQILSMPNAVDGQRPEAVRIGESNDAAA
jgi:response regulator NasT